MNTPKQTMKMNERLDVKITLIFLIMMVISIGSIAGISYNKSHNLLVNNLGAKSVKIAELASTIIDVEDFKKLNTVEDEKTDEYKKMRHDLEELRVFSGSKYIYIRWQKMKMASMYM